MENKILIIEDDYSISDALTFVFKKEGFIIKQSSQGKEGINLFNSFQPHLVLLDVMLPDMNGFDVCREISNKGAPVIMLTARNDIVDKVLGLELGADDYITKPFDVREVVTRVKVAIRRVKNYAGSTEEKAVKDILKADCDITVYKSERKVMKSGREIKLKPREFDLMLFLAENKGIVFTREKLLDKVWGLDYEGDSRTVDIHIRRLRSKLDDDGSLIETVFGVGYKMRASYED